MYFVPSALLIRDHAGASFWSELALAPGDFASLSWQAFLLDNLLPVTLGNLVGGSLLVGAVYWVIYLRPRARSES